VSIHVLFFGPIPPLFHGQSIAFQKATEMRWIDFLRQRSGKDN